MNQSSHRTSLELAAGFDSNTLCDNGGHSHPSLVPDPEGGVLLADDVPEPRPRRLSGFTWKTFDANQDGTAVVR